MRVIVTGAGIAGLSTAWALAGEGHEVVLLDQGPIPNPLSASADQHRIIRRAYAGQDGYARAISEAFSAWDALWADLGAAHYANTGVIAVSQHAGDEADRYRAGLERMGTPFVRLAPATAASDYPFLDPATFAYAIRMEEGGVLFSARIAHALAGWLAAAGAELRPYTRVTGLDADGAAVVTASGQRITGDAVVVTVGAWVTDLLPDLAPTLTPWRTAVAYLEPPPDLAAAWAGAPAILDVGGAVDGYVLPPVQGTGLKVGAGIHKVKARADERRAPEPGEGQRLRDCFAPPFARIDEYRVAEVVTCAYTFTRDEHFFAARRGRAWIVSACSGHGYKFGPAVGRRLARAVETGDADGLVRWIEARGG
ncbi:NAD(P)/FAD-dependent oxidoreductase [Futiania mangrovi]|uniref:FAD-dependent oxidoreductase n=1 Tax=Futiania mangrovi TaxID=2959716 RepID=A0A9J6PEV0_9PROT|nr:FAD-dependent oxidoreductase [Futiania mangrovii]MCP1337217.1 FAD-dependent oxidoreductase [Futiania mangrovii]